ncbi:MAG: hypothetical protein CVV34_01275 [Methanomicrobiales archaeon HGW-Methanomicrobiales-5]|nr:MAG: hypothetical protein CVV34_01275 [Methanomicrobiales archaeon HGW-Methanomicrobiales-5]
MIMGNPHTQNAIKSAALKKDPPRGVSITKIYRNFLAPPFLTRCPDAGILVQDFHSLGKLPFM